MSRIRMTINGKAVSAFEGQTVLEVCRQNDIFVPTLCHLDGLTDIGACRLCIVEIEGQRRPVPACTTPAEDGQAVLTSTPALEDLRRQTVELIFGERNHICPFCPRSGNCELQNAGYECNVDHLRYNYLFPTLPVDNSHPRIALDHNRCVLCARCIRACDEWIGAHVLDFDNRGSKSLLVADNGIPLGQSSCVSCGTCVSVCPTGALFEKRSAHWQGRLPKELTETICPGCGVGCRINASVRHRQIGEMSPAGGPSGNKVLCARGRFGLVNPTAPRVTAVKVKRGNQWVERPLKDVLAECARRLSSAPIQASPERVIALISPRLPLETISACQGFMTQVVNSPRWSIVDRTDATGIKRNLGMNGKAVPLAGLRELDEADMFLLVGCNLERTHGVIASYVRRGVLHRRAKLVKLNPKHAWLTEWTDLPILVDRNRDDKVLTAMLKYLIEDGKARLDMPEELAQRLSKMTDDDVTAATGVPAAQIREAARLYGQAQKPIVLCGTGVAGIYGQSTRGIAAAMNLVKAARQKTSAGRWRLMELAAGANTYGARLMGDSELNIDHLDPHSADVAFVVIGDDDWAWGREWIEKLRTISFVVVLTARNHEVLESAHVVIPTASWAERQGTYVNLEGRVQKGCRLMEPAPGCIDEVAFFEQLARAWRGPEFTWSPTAGLEPVRQLADGHMVPCQSREEPIDLAAIEALVAEV
ncbi:MAG: molybdopterin-dependent oxidoreductase [Phycisphaerae bacterium]|nr:molybdopterin-dependent oxidoreductase [Phycisphaerae bacterium]